MHRKKSTRLSLILMVIVALALTTLACNLAQSTSTSEPATEEARPTGEVAEPTQQEDSPTKDKEGGKEGGDESEATQAPEPISKGISIKNIDSLHEVHAIPASTRMLVATALSPTDSQGATFGADKYVRIWNTENGEMTYELGPHTAWGWGMAYSPDGTRLASGGGYEVILWDPATGKQLKSISVNANVYRLNWSPDSRYVAVVGEGSSKIDLIDTNSGSVTTRISTPAGKVLWAAVYSPDSAWIAVGDFDGSVTILDAESQAVISEGTTVQGKAIWDMEFSPDNKLLAICNGAGDIFFWDTASWVSIPELSKRGVHADPNPDRSGCKDGVFSKGGDIYFSAGGTTLSAWDSASSKLLQSQQFNDIIFSIALSGDGKLLGLVLNDGSYHLLGVD
jgi:WD40 repeat protein